MKRPFACVMLLSTPCRRRDPGRLMRTIWVAVLVLLWPLAGNAARPLPMYELQVEGRIAIGPDGAVRDYTLQSKLAPEIAAVVDRRVREWKFEPILLDGKPVIAETTMRLALLATPQDADRYALTIQNVWFGTPGRTGTMTPPRYPKDAVYAGLGAKVILVLRLDPKGNVVDVVPEQTSLTASGSERVAASWRQVFERASIAAAKKWKFDVTETIGGQPVESSIRVPVVYTLGNAGDTGQWKAFVPGPVRPVPWVGPETVASQADRDRLGDGDMQPLDSRFRLREGVVGTAL